MKILLSITFYITTNWATASVHNVVEFIAAETGQRIHHSCLASNPNRFKENVDSATIQGLTCLQSLADSGGQGALKNLTQLNNLLASKKVEIICNDLNYNWGQAIAWATTNSVPLENSVLRHPGIAINHNLLPGLMTEDETGTLEFRKTIFHEQLHNLGFRHGKNIEYAYACEKCCFNDPYSKDIACKICSGNYTGIEDVNYLKDISEYAVKSMTYVEAIKNTLLYIKAKPTDINGLVYLTKILTNVFNPIGEELFGIVSSQNVLTEDQHQVMYLPTLYSEYDSKLAFKESAKVIAKAFYFTLKDGDALKALTTLKANQAELKRTLNSQFPNTNPPIENYGYIQASMKQSLKLLITDIWIDGNIGHAQKEANRQLIYQYAFEVFENLKLASKD